MILKYSHKTLNWVDLEAPSEEELLYVMDLYSIPEFIKNDILKGSKNDRINLDYDYIFVSLEMPQIPSNEVLNNKIIFIVNDNLVLTIHNNKIQGLNRFSKEMELDIVTEEKIDNNKLLFAYLLKNLYKDSQQQLIDNGIKIKNLKNQILQKNKKLKKSITVVILLIILLILFIWL